jgi:hypothetical protein
MAFLHAAQRNALPGSSFAGPDRSFPINDANHARAALSMAHYAPNPAAIRAKVHARYPSIGARAFGGPVQAGRPYMVGERGPELMVPRGPGAVMPHMAGMGGGVQAPNPMQAAQHAALVNHFIRQGLNPHGR